MSNLRMASSSGQIVQPTFLRFSSGQRPLESAVSYLKNPKLLGSIGLQFMN
jgi:hypothetical protein